VKGGVSGAQALVTTLKGVRDMADLKAAETTLDALKSHVDVISRALEASGSTESRVQGMIDTLSKLDGNQSATDEAKKQGDDNLKALQLFMKSAARYSGVLKRTLSHMKSVSTATGKVFGV
jgi:predicted nuclease with TOPRIM domain